MSDETTKNSNGQNLTNKEGDAGNSAYQKENLKVSLGMVLREIRSIIIIIFFVFVFRSSFYEPFKIPSGSMIPTLMIGDFILVNKMAYGLKVPFSDLFSNPVYFGKPGTPERGDVIVFKYPKDPDINYIKRVIGLPGETVEVRNKVVFINGVEMKGTEFDGKAIMNDMDDKFKFNNFIFYKEKAGNHEHVFQLDDDNYFKTDFGPEKIPEGSYFVMGDNRDFSSDSRFWGVVPHHLIKGRAVLVWFSMIFPFTDNPYKFRPHRIGTKID